MRVALYPAPWMQGVLTGFLPLVMLCNSALAAGWSPGGDLELRFSQGVRVGVALLFLTGLALRRHGARFGVPGLAGWKTVFREGAAPVGLLCVVEAAAAAIALAV